MLVMGHAFALDHPLTAPEVRPETIWRWNTSTRIITGMVTITDGRRDGGRGLLEERLAGEERQRCRDGAGLIGGRERDAEHEVVPGEEEREDGDSERPPGRRAGTITLRNACHGRGPVHLGRLFHLPGDLPEERRERPDRQRQRERHVGDDQSEPRVVDARATATCRTAARPGRPSGTWRWPGRSTGPTSCP